MEKGKLTCGDSKLEASIFILANCKGCRIKKEWKGTSRAQMLVISDKCFPLPSSFEMILGQDPRGDVCDLHIHM